MTSSTSATRDGIPSRPVFESLRRTAAMTDESGQHTDGVECPEKYCSLVFPKAEEVVAHLQWDHNRSELESERKVRQSLEPDTDHS